MDYVQRAREVIDVEIEGLRQVRDALNSSFDAGVRLLMATLARGGKIVVTGIGKNLCVAEKISATLASTGATSVVLNPAQAMHGDLGILSHGDVLLALSYSGESEEVVQLVPIARRMGIKVISLTGSPDSSLGRYSDVVICVKVPREACPFNMAPTTTTTATMAVGDALAMVLLEARGISLEDYARLHPGGTIGRTLLLRVSDIMRTGDRLPRVLATAKVKDAIIAMTRARAGSAGIVDENNHLLGIFTDGDLRRHLPEQPDLLDHPVSEIMTRQPITVRSSQLAVDVLRVFEEHNIDDLLVVDDENHLVGAIDVQDLPKLKIM